METSSSTMNLAQLHVQRDLSSISGRGSTERTRIAFATRPPFSDNPTHIYLLSQRAVPNGSGFHFFPVKPEHCSDHPPAKVQYIQQDLLHNHFAGNMFCNGAPSFDASLFMSSDVSTRIYSPLFITCFCFSQQCFKGFTLFEPFESIQ